MLERSGDVSFERPHQEFQTTRQLMTYTLKAEPKDRHEYSFFAFLFIFYVVCCLLGWRGYERLGESSFFFFFLGGGIEISQRSCLVARVPL